MSPPASSKIGEPALPVADPGNYGMRPGHVVEAVTNAHNLLPPTVTSPSKHFQDAKSSTEEDDVRYVYSSSFDKEDCYVQSKSQSKGHFYSGPAAVNN